MESIEKIDLDNGTLENSNTYKKKENGVFGIVALFLIIANSLGIQGLLISLNQRNNIAVKLWEPSESFLFFTAPTFAFVSLILIWIISPRASQMKQIFTITGTIGTIAYLVYMVIIGYIFALGSGMRN